jgi:uncharacterized protein YodC (DUF2158 family)
MNRRFVFRAFGCFLAMITSVFTQATARASHRIGSVVSLNSGSPPLTVINVASYVTCEWNDVSGERHQATFPATCVR